MDVFLSDAQRQQYLIWLGEYAEKCGLAIWAYCLMSNHVHLVVVPDQEASISDMMRTLQMRHGQRVNAMQDASGHVWQGRYYSCPLDSEHAVAAVRYVERNPIRAGIVHRAEQYEWSSAAPHAGLRDDPALIMKTPQRFGVDDWPAWLQDEPDEQQTQMLRSRTLRGLPCGSTGFATTVSRKTGRDFNSRPRGRPPAQPHAGQ